LKKKALRVVKFSLKPLKNTPDGKRKYTVKIVIFKNPYIDVYRNRRTYLAVTGNEW